MELNPIAKSALDFFIKYCEKKKYQFNKSSINANDIKVDISDFHERTIVIIYHTGKIVLGGQKNNLKQEFEEAKKCFDQGRGDDLVQDKAKACTVNYDILLKDLREKIKKSLIIPETSLQTTDKPSSAIEWRLKFNRGAKVATLTQFSNGTLSIQGVEDKLLDEICDIVEKIANPSGKEIVARFVSGDVEALKKCTPEILEIAKKNIQKKLGTVYDFLEPYDKKWFIAAECLCLAKVPLPEFSPVVMPASKAFEGFSKKLLIRIKLCSPDHFKTASSNFGILNDIKDPKRIAICAKDNNIDTLLKRIDVCIKTNRHFLMHSDESVITKIDTQEEAKNKVDNILKDARDLFDTLNKIFKLV